MKKAFTLILALLLCMSCSTFLISCDDEQNTAETGAQTTVEETTTENTPKKGDLEGLVKEDSLNKLDNYTLTIEGKMSVTQDGQDQGVSDMKQVTKTANGKIEIILYGMNENGEMEPDEDSIVVEGEMAETQKAENNQLIEIILGEYKKFVYDSKTDSYSINETVVIEKDINGFSVDNEGNMISIVTPTKITIKNAKVTLTEDGKLACLVCDYTQEMTMGEHVIVTSGLTTWTVTDYGTTVIG